MSRPVTLFTGQWADLPLEDLARKASDFGYQGLELACWGDHFEIPQAINDENYVTTRRDLFREVYRASPELTLDPKYFSPRVIDVFRAAREGS